MPSLDPQQNAEEQLKEDQDKRFKYIRGLNYLEPPFPYKVIQFVPGLFAINDIPDPIDYTGRGIILGR